MPLLLAVEPLRHVGKVFVEHRYVVNEIVGLATVLPEIFEPPSFVIAYFQLPALFMGSINVGCGTIRMHQSS